MRFHQDRPEQQEVGVQGRRENDRLRREQETSEQRQERRLQAGRERRRLRRQLETTDQRRQHVDARRLHQYSIDSFKSSLQANFV